MKKILLSLVALAAFSFAANAQWYTGGTIGITAKTGNSYIGWNVSPEGGYILNDNMAVGASFVFGGNGQGNSSNFTFTFAPYYKWAFCTINSLRFWLQGEIGLGSYTYTQKDPSDGTNYSSTFFSWGIAVAPAISYDINEKWCINTKIASIGVSGIGDSASFDFMAINGPSIGVQYNF